MASINAVSDHLAALTVSQPNTHYPRAHLLGLPAELRVKILKLVFDSVLVCGLSDRPLGHEDRTLRVSGILLVNKQLSDEASAVMFECCRFYLNTSQATSRARCYSNLTNRDMIRTLYLGWNPKSSRTETPITLEPEWLFEMKGLRSVTLDCVACSYMKIDCTSITSKAELKSLMLQKQPHRDSKSSKWLRILIDSEERLFQLLVSYYFSPRHRSRSGPIPVLLCATIDVDKEEVVKVEPQARQIWDIRWLGVTQGPRVHRDACERLTRYSEQLMHENANHLWRHMWGQWLRYDVQHDHDANTISNLVAAATASTMAVMAMATDITIDDITDTTNADVEDDNEDENDNV